jgi:hypothetical protein
VGNLAQLILVLILCSSNIVAVIVLDVCRLHDEGFGLVIFSMVVYLFLQ